MSYWDKAKLDANRGKLKPGVVQATGGNTIVEPDEIYSSEQTRSLHPQFQANVDPPTTEEMMACMHCHETGSVVLVYQVCKSLSRQNTQRDHHTISTSEYMCEGCNGFFAATHVNRSH
eukprot:TRINITY_DN9582_c0_g3_i1.p1 TRINITY_DN9582_c0_g3~~TRINITY_DN9582_c0_g3_i1.p1  ORF type:complete len:118 (+),score=12.50 TRINITY_DN9582_c0_g3_i1:139-492(+)